MVVADVLKGKKTPSEAFNNLGALYRHLLVLLIGVLPMMVGAVWAVLGEYSSITMTAAAQGREIDSNSTAIKKLTQNYDTLKENQTRSLTQQEFIIKEQAETQEEIKGLRRGLDAQDQKLDAMTTRILEAIRNNE